GPRAGDVRAVRAAADRGAHEGGGGGQEGSRCQAGPSASTHTVSMMRSHGIPASSLARLTRAGEEDSKRQRTSSSLGRYSAPRTAAPARPAALRSVSSLTPGQKHLAV